MGLKMNRHFGVAVLAVSILVLVLYFVWKQDVKPSLTPPYSIQVSRYQNHSKTSRMSFTILYYNSPVYVNFRHAALNVAFDDCDYTNCQLTLDKSLVNKSDVILFDGRSLGKLLHRTPGQIWIFSMHESPSSLIHGNWRKQWKMSFNLSMSYDKQDVDVYWPYGEIHERETPIVKNYTSVFHNKTKDVLIITSNCITQSKREVFVRTLSKYIHVETLGACGAYWKCGRRLVHDNCFEIINKYKFYLAFENSMCRGYFTEKFYENYDYDTIMVVRGGEKGQAVKEFPEGTFISADSFSSIRELGLHLKYLSSSVTEYTRMLERKSHFHFPGYRQLFQETMCRLCDRLNNLHQINSTIPDIVDRVYRSKPCKDASDLND